MSSVTKWEYREYVWSATPGDLARAAARAMEHSLHLSSMGREGWELVSVVGTTIDAFQMFRYVFKREIELPQVTRAREAVSDIMAH